MSVTEGKSEGTGWEMERKKAISEGERKKKKKSSLYFNSSEEKTKEGGMKKGING